VGSCTIFEELHETGAFFGEGIMIDEGFFIFVYALRDLIEDADEDGDFYYARRGKDSIRVDGHFPTRPKIVYINPGDAMKTVHQWTQQGRQFVVGTLRKSRLLM